MKEIAVVATEKQYARFLMDNISKYLGRYASFKVIPLQRWKPWTG